MKTCTACNIEQPYENFYTQKAGDGYRSWCKPCTLKKCAEYQRRPHVSERRNAQSTKYRKQKPRTPEQNFKYSLWKSYRLKPEQYEEMLAAQDGKCASCGTDTPGGRGRFHVDHDHACCDTTPTCGKCARALLCSRCNPMIGMAGDDPEKLIAGAMYLLRFQGQDFPAFLNALGATV